MFEDTCSCSHPIVRNAHRSFLGKVLTANLIFLLILLPAWGGAGGSPPTSTLPAGTSTESQSQHNAKVEQQPATLRVTTRLINVSIVVHDKQGKPVAGLTRDDFELLDNGQPQKIAFFSEQSNQPLRGKAIPLPENAFSNQVLEQPSTPGSVNVILLDSLNIDLNRAGFSMATFTDQRDARAQLVRFLQELQPQDRVAIYTLGRSLRILHEFSNNSGSLLRALDSYHGERVPELDPPTSAAGVGDSEIPTSAKDAAHVDPSKSQEYLKETYSFYARMRANLTESAFKAVAEHLRGIQGRKNLLWVSTGFAISAFNVMDSFHESFDSPLESAARIFDDAGVTVYPIDVRGLIPADTRLSEGMINPLPNAVLQGPDLRAFDTMKYLADRTGGRAMYNTNDLGKSIRNAMDDSSDSYLLSFYPDHGKWNGEFHDLKIKMRPELKGLDVRSRRGYFANWETPLNHKQREARIEEAIGSPLDSSGIGIQVYVDEPSKPKSRYRFVQLFLDAHQIHLEQAKDRWNGSFDLVQVQRSPDGKVLTATDQTMKMRLAPATYEQVMRDGYHFSQQIVLAPGASDLRIIIRDTSTSALGSLTVPLASVNSKNEP